MGRERVAERSEQGQLDQLSINTIRMLAVDAVQAANSGHPGAPMGAAPLAYVLWTRVLRHNPADPTWPDRDRFVLSAGHASMLLYALLHLTGYDLPLEELKRFRQWGSRTPGHPENVLTPGVEVTTGPLGQGFANGVGMAIAERYLAAQFNQQDHEIVDHRVYALVSDGDLQEGVASEAASLAGRLQLGKLIYLYDDNHVQLDGPTEWAFTEDAGTRFEAYGWHVLRADGEDLEGIEAALGAAREETTRPSLVMVRTVIGHGSPNRAGTSKAHGEALGAEEVRLTKQNLGWSEEPTFLIPDEARERFRAAQERGRSLQAEWEQQFARHAEEYPELAREFERRQRGELPAGWDVDLPTFSPSEGAVATRVASNKVLSALVQRLPELLGGSADLATSTGTLLKDQGDFGPGAEGNRTLRFGVREHAMGSIAVGISRHGGVIPYTATFMVFSDYMRPPIRLASLSQARVVFVFSHDSVGLGEDGPTHQPVEQLLALRAIPHMVVLRPGDANETREAWRVALARSGPTCLILTRQGVPVLDRAKLGAAEDLAKGAYVLAEAEGGHAQVVLIGTGSEVSIALEAGRLLATQGVRARVVSMPSWELYDAQPQVYRDTVLPPALPKLSIEAGTTRGWSDYVGSRDHAIGVDRFGASAPYKEIYEQLGLTAEHLAERAREVLGR